MKKLVIAFFSFTIFKNSNAESTESILSDFCQRNGLIDITFGAKNGTKGLWKYQKEFQRNQLKSRLTFWPNLGKGGVNLI